MLARTASAKDGDGSTVNRVAVSTRRATVVSVMPLPESMEQECSAYGCDLVTVARVDGGVSVTRTTMVVTPEASTSSTSYSWLVMTRRCEFAAIDATGEYDDLKTREHLAIRPYVRDGSDAGPAPVAEVAYRSSRGRVSQLELRAVRLPDRELDVAFSNGDLYTLAFEVDALTATARDGGVQRFTRKPRQ